MKKRMPWMKLGVNDRYIEWGHLDIAQIGALFKLVMIAWSRVGVSIPSDPDWIKARLGVDDDRYDSDVNPVLDEFWEVEGDDLILPWLRDEAKDAAERSFKAKEKADRRWATEKSAAQGENIHRLRNKENF